jgi:hypothetical protein
VVEVDDATAELLDREKLSPPPTRYDCVEDNEQRHVPSSWIPPTEV